MKRMSLFIVLMLVVVAAGFGCVQLTHQNQTSTGNNIDRAAILLEAKKQGLIMGTEETQHMRDASVLFEDSLKQSFEVQSRALPTLAEMKSGALADVTGGGGYGLVHTSFAEGTFTLFANFGQLTALSDGSTYHAWLVTREGEMRIVSLGEVRDVAFGEWFVYTSKTDLSASDFFVVTLQAPGQASPGEHILEGVIRQ